MQDFQFYSAKTIEDALSYLSDIEGECKIIAGGTDLLPLLRKEDIRPDYVLNIYEIEGLRGVTETEDEVKIGPTTTFSEIIESEILNRCLPLLVQAAFSVGGPQIRNRGTIGGNLCTASPAADVLPAVMALDGELECRSMTSGTRLLPLAEAIEVPYETRLQVDEILTNIHIRKLPPGTRSGFEKLGRRKAMTRARMNMSIVLSLDREERISELRIVPGAVMPVARRMTAVEKTLIGKKPAEGLLGAAAELLAEGVVEVTGPRWSSEYKIPVIQNVFKRVFRLLLGAS